jgi:hypothetical protein
MRFQYQSVRIAARAAVAGRTAARWPDLASVWICWIRLLIDFPAVVLPTTAPLELAMSESQTRPRD